MRHLPDKTVERLSQYRRSLSKYLITGKDHIFSHELANLLHITPVQVRRDIMLIEYSGTLRKGYNVVSLIDLIGKIIDNDHGFNIAIIGTGNLGKAIMHYLNDKKSKLNIIAAFDINPEKTNKSYLGIPTYHIDELTQKTIELNLKICIISTPPEVATEVAKKIVDSGIKGILNFTTRPLNVPENIYIEELDMITSLEKVAFFVKENEALTS